MLYIEEENMTCSTLEEENIHVIHRGREHDMFYLEEENMTC